jgi:hypothetical protein
MGSGNGKQLDSWTAARRLARIPSSNPRATEDRRRKLEGEREVAGRVRRDCILEVHGPWREISWRGARSGPLWQPQPSPRSPVHQKSKRQSTPPRCRFCIIFFVSTSVARLLRRASIPERILTPLPGIHRDKRGAKRQKKRRRRRTTTCTATMLAAPSRDHRKRQAPRPTLSRYAMSRWVWLYGADQFITFPLARQRTD